MSGTSVVRLVDSITELGAQDAGCIAISGSHGGASSARYAIAARPLLSVFNDAGVGKDAAGIEALKLLQAEGLAACTVAHDAARIGYAESSLREGIVSHANALALALGIQPGVPLREQPVVRQTRAASASRQVAVVVGALGVIGRYIVDHLQQVGPRRRRRDRSARTGARHQAPDRVQHGRHPPSGEVGFFGSSFGSRRVADLD